MISEEKQTMRAAMRAELRGMPLEARAAASLVIARGVREEIDRAGARLVLGFAPMGTEPEWVGGEGGAGASESTGENWRVAFPRIVGVRLEFVVVRGVEELRVGERELRAPVGGEVVDPAEADIILVPGLAFDRAGGRLGRGGGFYDRVLADLPVRVRRVGVAFARQVVGSVPTGAHDARVDRVIFETGALECNSPG